MAYDRAELEKNFTSPSFTRAESSRQLRRGGQLNERPSDVPPEKTHDYDKLLHRRKGISGSEFAGVGLQFAITIVLFALAGIWLDKRLGSSPWLLIILVLGGAALAFWSMVRRMTGKG